MVYDEHSRQGMFMKVFLSHTASDDKLAQQFAAILENEGYEVWDDERDLMPGENWLGAMSRALEEAQAMVVLLTPNALRSTSVRREIEYALAKQSYNRKSVIPVLVGDAEHLPMEDVPWILRQLQVVKVRGPEGVEEGAREVVQALADAA
jgi:hypothetical protein